jgi:acyl-ACP thioesterase
MQRGTVKSEKKSKWTDEYRINWFDADCTGRLTLTSLCGFLEETAWRHANHLGFGWSETNDKGFVWVVLRLQMQIDEWPLWNQTIRVITWHRGIDKIMAYRDFLVEDMKGRVLARVVSTWLVLDMTSRRPVRPEIAKDALSHGLTESALPHDADKLSIPANGSPLAQYTVSFPDIDLNEHANHVRYPEWVMRFLPVEDLKNKKLVGFSVNYLAEAHAGDVIDLISEGDLNDLHIGGIRHSDDKQVFAAKFNFKNKG